VANVLSADRQIAIIAALAEGSSIRAIERMTGDPDKPAQHVAVLHVPPVVSPLTAVRAFISQEIRNAETA